MTPVRPPMANFKMPVRADCAVSACSPLPPSIKALAPWLSRRESAFGQASTLSPGCRHPKQSKLSFPPTWPLYWLLSGEQPDPPFGYRNSFEKITSRALAGCWPGLGPPLPQKSQGKTGRAKFSIKLVKGTISLSSCKAVVLNLACVLEPPGKL